MPGAAIIRARTMPHPALQSLRRRRAAGLPGTALAWALLALAGPARAEPPTLEEIVVTAERRAEPALQTPLSIGRVGAGDLRLVGETHASEVLNRVPGVMIQRGSGQESLTAIRSPVLTGAGSCGAFLFLENGVSIRPVGFCNVNEMLEINVEQAEAVEVIRGTGGALYGSSAMHGIVNVLQPLPSGRARLGAGLVLGPDDYRRASIEGRLDGAQTGFGLAALHTHDGGWRDSSGFDEAKLNATWARGHGATPWRVDLAATDLDQQTAGFIVGQDAYRDERLAASNPNPEAYRAARALRLTGSFTPTVPLAATLELRPYLRHSRMDFLQHFLLGKPLERNGQDSAGLLSALRWTGSSGDSAVVGADLEVAQSTLVETQVEPTTGGSAAANAIRPAGRHYDYRVDSRVAALYGEYARRIGERWRVDAGVRAEYVVYDYDNRMLAGNTDERGVPCDFGGCLYSRPADRTDTFVDLAPKLSVSVALAEGLQAYATVARGFRPPEMTELYRLQRAQRVADLQSERLDTREVGLKGRFARAQFALAAFDMDKQDVILRESNGFNVGNGRTSHRGLEYDLSWSPLDALLLSTGGTFARHRYEFTRAVEGGERIERGNDIDTAPRRLQRVALQWQPSALFQAEAEWQQVGGYWLDAANEHRYRGHELVNLRGRWFLGPQWTASLRISNLLDRAYADRADYAFGTYRYFPGRGRATFAELSWGVQ